MLDNVPWHALNTEHSHFAVYTSGAGRKYPADVAPFGGTADNSPESLRELVCLLSPGETIYIEADSVPDLPGSVGHLMPALQMVLASPTTARNAAVLETPIVSLTASDASAMIELTSLAYPGFFRPRTHEMGAYFGVRLDGNLLAMAGERMALPNYREISGVCTHPAHTGKGYAALLIGHLMGIHAKAGLRSFLHVGASNSRAISLYRRLGFSVRKELSLYPISLPDGEA